MTRERCQNFMRVEGAGPEFKVLLNVQGMRDEPGVRTHNRQLDFTVNVRVPAKAFATGDAGELASMNPNATSLSSPVLIGPGFR
jgi:hypothetical protein